MKAKQLSLPLPRRGGRRKGAGRPRTRPHPGLIGPGVPHLARAEFPSRHPVHVTMRLQPGIGYLRAHRRAKLVQHALRVARERFGVRIIHYSVQGNHLHLIVEAEGAAALSRAMQGLATRLAKRLNALANRRGGVFADRYHARTLTSPREVGNAIRYVVTNYHHHARESLPPGWADPLATRLDTPLAAPKIWLLRSGWTLAPPLRRARADSNNHPP